MNCEHYITSIYLLYLVYLEQGLMVRDAKKLAMHYLRTPGFRMDVLSVVPTDILYAAFGLQASSRALYRRVTFTRNRVTELLSQRIQPYVSMSLSFRFLLEKSLLVCLFLLYFFLFLSYNSDVSENLSDNIKRTVLD